MSKKVLIIGLILILIISGTVTIVLTRKTDNEKNMDVEEQVGDVETKFKREKVSNSTVFYTVEDCINFYIDSVKAEEKDKIFELLDEKYINENNINQENVLKYVEKPKNSFIALDMYESELNNVCSYIVEGVENDGIYNTKMYFRVGLDTNNFSFNIMPLSAKKYNSIDEIEESESIAEIPNNDANSYQYNRIRENEIIEKILKYYCNLTVNNAKKAYDMLEQKYREKRFDKYSEFQAYIKKRSENLKQARVAGYSVKEEENKKTYTVVDQDGRVYIFKQKSIMNFTVQMDDYTLETDEYKEKYMNSTVVDKIKLNVNKFMEMISNYDYDEAYGLLDETYKKNNFKTEKLYEKFIEQHFYNSNAYSIEKIETDAQDYIITINVAEKASASAPQRKNKIAMRLGENTEFTMAVILDEK